MMRFFIIYKTTCLVTGKFYVGMHCTDNLNDGYLGSGKILKLSIRKHGVENHVREVLLQCESFEQLCNEEKRIISYELNNPLCMNLKEGGSGGWGYVNTDLKLKTQIIEASRSIDNRNKRSQEQISRWSDLNYRERFYLSVRSKEYRDRRSAQMKSLYKNVELSNKIRESKLGSKNPAFGKKWMHKDGESILVDTKDISSRIDKGWKLGRIYKRK